MNVNFYNELLMSVVNVIRHLREDGWRYREIDEALGLTNKTAWSAYRLMKRPRVKQFVAFQDA